MNRRLDTRRASLVALAATVGLTCHHATHRANLEQPKPPATMSSAHAIGTTTRQTASTAPDAKHSPAFLALRGMDREKACALTTTIPVVRARAGAKPFEALDANCGGSDDSFCDTVEVAPKGADACYVSNDHIRNAQKKASVAVTIPARPNNPWDGMKKPQYFDRIDAHLHLDDYEETLLEKNGFVVLDRLAYTNYAHAFHDIFQEELPLYVGTDPILHAVFRATDVALGQAERTRLAPALDKMLKKLRTTLGASKANYDDVTRNDLDVFLGVATQLAKPWSHDEPPPSLFGQDAIVTAMLDTIGKEGLVSINVFGRERMIDASQFTPRGHYSHFDPRFNSESYFRVLTWLTRFEWNLVSRGSRSSHPGALPDTRETPREARDALALADLFRRSNALTELAAFEEVYTAFGGRREDVGIVELLRLMDQHKLLPNDPNAPEKLKVAIGNGYRRTARVHFMPQGVTELPVITTIIGPRIAPDIAPLERLVHDALPNRYELGVADVGYMLGHDRAENYLREDLRQYPKLKDALNAARADLAQRTNQSQDVQGSFLGALLALAKPAEGIVPSFMKRDAYADLRMSSALVGYGQLRHTFVLLSGQGYDAYGCAIPDAYVEPIAPFYAALIEHVQRMRKITGSGFDGLLRVLGTLQSITKSELSRGAPTAAQTMWLGMVAEFVPEGGFSDSGEPPKWTGWYFDMFDDREQGATKAADFIADYFTLTNVDKVAYLGAEGPRLGVFIVDTGGQPRAMVGPVARGYEIKAPIATRLNDTSARTSSDKQFSFRESFAAKPWTEPQIGLGVNTYNCSVDGKLEVRILLAADRQTGPVTVTLLDHHADPLAPPLTRSVTDEIVVFPFLFPEVSRDDKEEKPDSQHAFYEIRKLKYLVEALSIRIEDLGHSGLGKGPYDYFTSPSVFFGKGDEESMSQRPTGVHPSFVIGGSGYSSDPGKVGN